MSAGLGQHAATRHAFFNDEEFTVALYNGQHGQIGW
jgi:hypothetical protein